MNLAINPSEKLPRKTERRENRRTDSQTDKGRGRNRSEISIARSCCQHSSSQKPEARRLSRMSKLDLQALAGTEHGKTVTSGAHNRAK
ncbi:hypothetical protein RRG08_052408 [Elysia crispata]|uniref:Uncharacterized protein n=1 Tax=Elysia crispata TaxID=231223 RepID=A0AAE1B1E8_9GAST|nr:hypothetical protein RRG08_052408 [Elysia crispata]